MWHDVCPYCNTTEHERIEDCAQLPQLAVRMLSQHKKQTEQPTRLVTYAQLVNWSARLARLAYSIEDEIPHNSVLFIAAEIKSVADKAESHRDATG